MQRGLPLCSGDVGGATLDQTIGRAKLLSGAFLGARAVDALGNTRRLAAAIAQIIEPGATTLAAAHDLHGIDHRRENRENALDTLAVGNLANGEALLQSAAAACDAD